MKKFIISLLILLISPLYGSDVDLGGDYYTKILTQYMEELEGEKAALTKKFQTFFDKSSSQLGFGMSYLPSSPAQNLKFGILPTIEVGLEISVLQIDTDDEMWEYVIADSDVPAVFIMPKLRANMSLPFDFEIGVLFSMVPNTNIYLLGGELKWSLIGTYNSFFNLSIRGAATKLFGVDELSLASFEGNLSMSFDFKVLIPYFGGGVVNIISEAEVPSVTDEMIDSVVEDADLDPTLEATLRENFPVDDPFVELEKYNHIVPKFFIGARFDLWIINFNAEVAFSYDFSEEEYINTVYTLRANFSF